MGGEDANATVDGEDWLEDEALSEVRTVNLSTSTTPISRASFYSCDCVTQLRPADLSPLMDRVLLRVVKQLVQVHPY